MRRERGAQEKGPVLFDEAEALENAQSLCGPAELEGVVRVEQRRE